MKHLLTLLIVLVVAGFPSAASKASAQGCVAAHSNQRVLNELVATDAGGPMSSHWYHNLTIDIGYRVPGGKKILWSLKRGQPTKATFRQLCEAVAPAEFELLIQLNLGRADAVMYAADLTEEYVDFNKGDVGDPGSLGG